MVTNRCAIGDSVHSQRLLAPVDFRQHATLARLWLLIQPLAREALQDPGAVLANEDVWRRTTQPARVVIVMALC